MVAAARCIHYYRSGRWRERLIGKSRTAPKCFQHTNIVLLLSLVLTYIKYIENELLKGCIGYIYATFCAIIHRTRCHIHQQPMPFFQAPLQISLYYVQIQNHQQSYGKHIEIVSRLIKHMVAYDT